MNFSINQIRLVILKGLKRVLKFCLCTKILFHAHLNVFQPIEIFYGENSHNVSNFRENSCDFVKFREISQNTALIHHHVFPK